jgi:hypothetical protein
MSSSTAQLSPSTGPRVRIDLPISDGPIEGTVIEERAPRRITAESMLRVDVGGTIFRVERSAATWLD